MKRVKDWLLRWWNHRRDRHYVIAEEHHARDDARSAENVENAREGIFRRPGGWG